MDAYFGKALDFLAEQGAPIPIALQEKTDGKDGMPTRPGGVLVSHVILRGAQVGSVFGAFGGGAVALWSKLPVQHAMSWAARGALLGAAATAAKLTDGKAPDGTPLTSEGVIDRGYRIAHNEKCHFGDCVSGASAAAGFVLSKCKVGGAGMGLAIGIASSPLLYKYAYTPGSWANW